MSRKEREEEIIRLMKAMEGDGEFIEITEQGDIAPITLDWTDEAPLCQLCNIRLDPGVWQEVIGMLFCLDCAPEAETLSRLQFDCLICRGKRLIFWGHGQIEADKHGWQPCEMCQGKGWIDGIVARWNGAI
jgi:hypothetical protein